MAGGRSCLAGAVRRPSRCGRSDLAAEVATEVRLPRATQAELDRHAAQRADCSRWVDPLGLARSLPGLAQVGGPALAATMGPAKRFPTAANLRSFTGLAPRASETGNTDRKPQPISKAGNRLLRTTLHRAADTARRLDPQLARVYYVQMVQRGKDHLGAVQGGRRAPGRAGLDGHGPWYAMPYVICDTDGTPVTPQQAKRIIAQHWTVSEEVRRRRRSRKAKGKAPQQVLQGHAAGAQGATRRPSSPASLGRRDRNVKLAKPRA